jgi:TonB family protein
MNTAVARLNWEGQVVDGKFPLQKWLGGSEQCDVFRTQLPGQPPQAAAIKLIAPEAGDAERQVSNWQMAATLTHPHLLRVLHAGRCKINDTPLIYVVVEYAEEDLSQVLPARALSPQEVREMIAPLLDAISYLHSRGLVHGRIKPSNIMAVGDQLKVSGDSVRAANESGTRTLPRSAFDAPEVARGGTSRASDIWSLGVTLVRCLSQGAQVRESYNPVEQGISQTIPEPFRHIARECLRPDPKARCTPADIREWLRPTAPSTVPLRQPRGRARPSLGAMALIAAIVVLALIFVVKWATHDGQEHSAQSGQQQPATGAVSTQPSSANSTPSFNPPTQAAQGGVTERVLPNISVSARNTIQGKIRVSVRVAVNPAGEVTEATLASPGPSKYFANKALEASRRWKFKPTQVDGRPVSSEWILRFQIGRAGTEVVPTESKPGTR